MLAALAPYIFALCATGCFALSMVRFEKARHILHVEIMQGALTTGLILLGIGFVLGGFQAGPAPVIPRQQLLVYIRGVWAVGGLLLSCAALFLVVRGWNHDHVS